MARDRRKEDLGETAERLLSDPRATETVGPVTVVAARLDLDRTEMMELSRILSREAGRVVILASEREGRGTLFVGSTAPGISAANVVEAAKPAFDGKGGGSPAAATAVGEPGAPLATALDAARLAARGTVAA